MDTRSNANFLVRDAAGDIHPVITADSFTAGTITLAGAGGPPATTSTIQSSTNSISAGGSWNFDRVTIDDIEFNEISIWVPTVDGGVLHIGTTTPATSPATVDAANPTDLRIVDGALIASGSGTFGTMVVDGGSITDSTGAISFGDENLTTTGFVDVSAVHLDNVKTLHSDVSNNLFCGATAGSSITTGIRNVVFGPNSGAAITEGDNNTIVGYDCANSLTTGIRNFVFGSSTAAALTTGSSNTIIGISAGQAIDTGSNNIAIGVDACRSGTDVVGAVCIGTEAGRDVTSGVRNTFIGHQSGQFPATGSSDNTAVGYRAIRGASANVGTGNTSVGSAALTGVSTGGDNLAIGAGSSQNVTTGSRNVAIGRRTGQAVSTASDNIYIGNGAGLTPDALSKVVAFGTSAAATASSQLIFGSATHELTDGYFGEGPVAASPGDFTLHGTGGSGTDNPSGDLILSVGQSTGDADPARMVFQTTMAGSTGTTPQTLLEMASIDSGIFTLGAAAPDNMTVNRSGAIDFGSDEAGLSSGHMGQDDTSTVITISVANTDVIVDGMIGGLTTNGMVFQNAQEFKAVQSGTYQVCWQLSFTSVSANQEIEGVIHVNSARQALTSSHRRISTATDTGSMSGCGLVDLAIDDLVSVQVRNETSTANIIIEHANVILTQISGPGQG